MSSAEVTNFGLLKGLAYRALVKSEQYFDSIMYLFS
jgi:hypothetical protein